MARSVRCRVTGEYGNSDDFIKIGNKYYKNQQVYDIWKKENEERNQVIDIIAKDFLDYTTGQIFPTLLTKKLKELEYYGFDVIKETIEISRSSILYSIKTKIFKTDLHKISYIMAIIKNNINDVYREHIRKQKTDEIQDIQIINIEEMESETIMNIGSKKKGSDISEFLEDDMWS